ncbi:MAG: TRAP transporter small permease [Eubacterium sp.]|nr:TRAP transporter small permease [Eubacterium sp.]
MSSKSNKLKGNLGKADEIILSIIKHISYISAVCLFIIMMVAFLNVLGEKIFHHGIPASTEIIKYLHVPVVFLSAAFVTLDRGQTSIDLVCSHFPEKVQKITATFNYLLGAFMSGFVSVRGFVQFTKNLSSHARSAVSGFGFPLWPFSLIFSFGFFLISFSFIWSIVRIYAEKEDRPFEKDEKEEGGND